VFNLATVRANYHAWIGDARFKAVFEELRGRISELKDCDLVRICDFLVWQAGKLNGQATQKVVDL
jgi:hypothetical protein